jgi:hypothetical protein
MNPEVKELWTEALNSGRYRQGQGNLKARQIDSTITHCCLGVLCEVAVEAGIIREDEHVTLREDVEAFGFVEEGNDYPYSLTLPPAVAMWAGMDQSGSRPGRLSSRVPEDMDTLWKLNDRAGYSFEEIATVIEREF